MASVKAVLTVTLKANDVVVAEVEDAALWQRVLAVINNGKSAVEAAKVLTGLDGETPQPGEKLTGGNGAGTGTSPIEQLATQLEIDSALLQGACSPSVESPFLHLDLHYWEAMKKQTAERGPTALAPAVVAATLLCLWFFKAGSGNPTQSQVQAVLSIINVTDRNASRAIQKASWLQGRSGGQVVLNPAEISKAVKLAKCFCIKDWSGWKEPAKS